jgi:hypothetical protein
MFIQSINITSFFVNPFGESQISLTVAGIPTTIVHKGFLFVAEKALLKFGLSKIIVLTIILFI